MLDAWIWYEDKQSGLGDRFLNEVYKRIEAIEQHPERYAERKKRFHETKIKTFPYLIIYRIEKEDEFVIIASIFHTSRNPNLKYK